MEDVGDILLGGAEGGFSMTAVDEPQRGLSRRGFLLGAGAAGALLWARVDRVTAEELVGCATPPGFPAGIELSKRRFESWSGEIVVDAVWTAAAGTPADVVAIASWAAAQGYAVRASGFGHAFPPITLTEDQGCDDRVVLVDTRALASMTMESATTVRAQTGVTLEALLAFLDAHGAGLTSVPAVGQVTLGGVLAIDGHGAATPAVGEVPVPGDGYGSISNQLVSVTAVAWDPATASYALRTFDRATTEATVLATHLGRAFLTEVVLRVGPARTVRCQSILDQPSSVVFAAPSVAGPNSFGALLDRAGRVESIRFPFAERPWTKVWTLAPTKPGRSRKTSGPYPYTFSDSFPIQASVVVDQLVTGPGPRTSIGQDLLGGAELGALADRIVGGEPEITPLFGQTAYAASRAGLSALGATDLWGPAFHTQLYIKATTLRFGQVGFTVLCARADVQRIVHEFAAKVDSLLEGYRGSGRYPINGPLEIRASGIDRPGTALVPGARAPSLSAAAPPEGHPTWDTALWVNLMTFPGTEGSPELFTELEAWVRSAFAAPLAEVRVEWSKGWAYTPEGPWTNAALIDDGIPGSYAGWDEAREQLDALDPHRVFTNPFLDRLLPPTSGG